MNPVVTAGSRLHLCQICTGYFTMWYGLAYVSMTVLPGILDGSLEPVEAEETNVEFGEAETDLCRS